MGVVCWVWVCLGFEGVVVEFLELGFELELLLDLVIPVGLGLPGPRPPFIFLEEDFKRLFLPILCNWIVQLCL